MNNLVDKRTGENLKDLIALMVHRAQRQRREILNGTMDVEGRGSLNADAQGAAFGLHWKKKQRRRWPSIGPGL